MKTLRAVSATFAPGSNSATAVRAQVVESVTIDGKEVPLEGRNEILPITPETHPIAYPLGLQFIAALVGELGLDTVPAPLPPEPVQ